MNDETFTKKELWWMTAILEFHRNELPTGVSYAELHAKLTDMAAKAVISENLRT